MSQTYVFGGSPVQPSQVSYSALALTGNTELQWPWVDQDTDSAVPLYLDVTPTGAYSITLPDATGASPGQAVIVYNIGASTITILDNSGSSITTVTAGIGKYIILRSNATAAGTWRALTFGAGSNAVDASALAGYGLSALSGATLNANSPVSAITSSVTATATYRAQVFEVTTSTGAGTLSFSAVATLGNGWWMGFSNLGTGAWTLDPNGSETIDGQTSITLNPTESCLIFSSGSALYTIGRGRSVDFVYTALNKDVAGNTDVTLTSTEASNLLIKLFGALTGNINLIVPSVVNEYMIRNATTGSYTVTVKTSGGTGVVATQGEQAFIKCDGTDCFNVVTNIPVSGSYQMQDGSTSLPGLPFENEVSTGFSRPASGTLAMSVLGNEVFGLTASAVTSYQNLTVVSTDAGASVGPLITAYRNSASPADNDILGSVNFDGEDDGSAQTTYAAVRATALDVTDGTEDGSLDFYTQNAGTLAKRAFVGQGLVVGAGADNGAGTITSTGAIASGSSITAAAGLSGTTGTFTDAVGITKAGTGLTVTSSTTGNVAQLVSTDAGASASPLLDVYRNSASPAPSDVIGGISLSGQNSTPAQVTYSQILATITDPTAASEDATLAVLTMVAGALAARLTVGQGIYVGSPTGGDKGTGTVNATAYYLNGTAFGNITRYYGTYSTNADLSTTIPYDNTIPLSTEGTQIVSLNVVTTSATQRVRLTFSGFWSQNGGFNTAALFQGTTCINAMAFVVNANGGSVTIPPTEVVVGSATTTTFSVRVGASSGSVRLNGTGSTRLYGGAAAATLSAEVWEP